MKNFPVVSIVAVIIFGLAVTQVHAQIIAVVAVEPVNKTVPNIGATFDMNITITDVVNLQGYEFMLWFNNTLLNATTIVMPPGAFLEPTDPTKIFIGKNEINNNYNTTHGRVWFAATLLPPETPKTGSGVLNTVTFKSKAQDGPSPLTLLTGVPVPFQYPVKLSNSTAQPIPNVANPAYITVVPEFPAALIVPLLIATTTTAVILGKTARLRKREILAVK